MAPSFFSGIIVSFIFAYCDSHLQTHSYFINIKQQQKCKWKKVCRAEEWRDFGAEAEDRRECAKNCVYYIIWNDYCKKWSHTTLIVPISDHFFVDFGEQLIMMRSVSLKLLVAISCCLFFGVFLFIFVIWCMCHMHCNQLGCSDFPLSLANNLKPEIVPRLNAHIAIVRGSYWMTMLIAFFLLLHNTKNFDHSIEIAFLFRSALLFHSKDFVHTRYEWKKCWR